MDVENRMSADDLKQEIARLKKEKQAVVVDM